MIRDTCTRLQEQLPQTSSQILEEFKLLHGHPWSETARDVATTTYSCLFGVVQPERPRKILEIGTAFGMSAAALLKACQKVDLYVTMDLGIYGDQLGATVNNIEFAQSRIHDWCRRNHVARGRVRFYRANTQPAGYGDNDNLGADVTRWSRIPEIVRLLQSNEFDVIFVDGKHTDDGLLNDLRTFWPFLRPGGLAICDDLHNPAEFAGVFQWVGDTWRSFHAFLENYSVEIDDYFVWNYPQVPPVGKSSLRPFGLIRKKQSASDVPIQMTPGFEAFDTPDAIEINRARQDHLASLGLDLTSRSVLEVGAGVGWHTEFFQKLCCTVVSTDARPQNVQEHLNRYPYRKERVKVADLSVPGSHDAFGEFDIVYCYGTLYHLDDPALCIRDLSKVCRGLLLLETCVDPLDNGQINLVKENGETPNQSFHSVGCRPSREWVLAALRKHFSFVYLTTTQPNHAEFPVTWPAVLPPGVINARAVFVASRHVLDMPTLSPRLLHRQKRLQPIDFSQSESLVERLSGGLKGAIDHVKSKGHSRLP